MINVGFATLWNRTSTSVLGASVYSQHHFKFTTFSVPVFMFFNICWSFDSQQAIAKYCENLEKLKIILLWSHSFVVSSAAVMRFGAPRKLET